jgi:hypothetical protein
MAEGVRLTVVIPQSLATALKARAEAEQRSASSLGAYLLESGIRSLPPLPGEPKWDLAAYARRVTVNRQIHLDDE